MYDDWLTPPPDAGADADICESQPYLACDGPEDCPGGYCCEDYQLLDEPHASCYAPPPSSTLFFCPGFGATLCDSDSQCPSNEHCVVDDGGGGGQNYDPLAGFVSTCQ